MQTGQRPMGISWILLLEVFVAYCRGIFVHLSLDFLQNSLEFASQVVC